MKKQVRALRNRNSGKRLASFRMAPKRIGYAVAAASVVAGVLVLGCGAPQQGCSRHRDNTAFQECSHVLILMREVGLLEMEVRNLEVEAWRLVVIARSSGRRMGRMIDDFTRLREGMNRASSSIELLEGSEADDYSKLERLGEIQKKLENIKAGFGRIEERLQKPF